MITITESNLEFEFDDQDLFYIEKCDAYTSIITNTKICEFAFIKNGAIVFLEAKQSFSKPESKENFATNISEITAKMQNAISLYSGLNLGRKYPQRTALTEKFKLSEEQKIYCILVVVGFHKDWLNPINDALQISLQTLKKTFSIDGISVINDEIAIQKGYAKRKV
jgi:hypothetical protein